MKLMNGRFTTALDAITFLLAGKATVTLESAKTGARYTYKVTKSKPKFDGDNTVYFVSLLVGPDNGSSYAYLGYIGKGCRFSTTKKSRFSPDAVPVRAFQYALDKFQKAELPDVLHVWHEGRCGRCGRKLTVPESIQNGLGPECVQHIHS